MVIRAGERACDARRPPPAEVACAVAQFVFWAAVGLIAYHHLGYPALVHVLARRTRGPARPDRPGGPYPSVTVIVPAHNEAAVIEAKIHNLMALDYPAGRWTAVVALDGCTDATRALAERALDAEGSSPIVLAGYEPNIGKVAVLNDQIARARTDIVVLTDASALVASDALTAGVAPFLDPGVGVVTGRYSVEGLEGHGEAAYWRYQSEVRERESALAGPIGAHGAFYLFRRSAWMPLPPDTINDDFVLPMSIVLRGFRAVYQPAIVARELERSKSRQEFRRRIRIGAGNLQQVLRLAKLGLPHHGWLAFAFLSGKGLRAMLPFLLAAALAASVVLAAEGRGLFTVFTCAEGAAIAFAIWGGRIHGVREGRLSGTLLYVLEGYLALAVGAVYVLFRREAKVWKLSKAVDKGRPA